MKTTSRYPKIISITDPKLPGSVSTAMVLNEQQEKDCRAKIADAGYLATAGVTLEGFDGPRKN